MFSCIVSDLELDFDWISSFSLNMAGDELTVNVGGFFSYLGSRGKC